MGKLTKREKIMIMILIYFALLAGGMYLLIVPALENYNQLSGQVTNEKLSAQQIRLSIQNANTVKAATEKKSSVLKSLSAHYYDSMTTVEVDKLITAMLTSYALTPQSLKVGTPVQTTLKTQAGQTTSGGAASTASATMLVSKVSVDATGLRSSFIALAEAVSKNPSLCITGFTVDANSKSTESGAISIDFEVLMYDKVKE